jgi:purine-nucleoside phosphorylase
MYDRIEAARAFIAGRTIHQPTIGLILGSGLSGLADQLDAANIIPYTDIPDFPHSTVEGHKGELALGQLGNQVVAVMRGRFHFYEGYDLEETTFPVRVLKALGVDTLIITNAAGGLRADWHVGDLMLITDHINIPGMAGQNPLRGPNDPRLGLRFPALTYADDDDLGALAQTAAASTGISLRSGVYAMLAGPSFETPAELRMLQLLGADAVGMSTVPEVIVARHGGMRVLAISMISNIATPDAPPANHIEVLQAGEAVKDAFAAMLYAVLAGIQPPVSDRM